MSPMSARSLFRDVQMPHQRHDRYAYERFMLDTYADRREAAPATESKVGALARRLRSILVQGGK